MAGIQTASAGSPLGTALMGKRVGEKIVVRAPAGEFPLEVVGLRGS
jgi:transcription elongation GreA/GreB family factor